MSHQGPVSSDRLKVMGITPEEMQHFTNLFKKGDQLKQGNIPAKQAYKLFQLSNLPQNTLTQIWRASSKDTKTLTLEDFCVALRLVSIAQSGQKFVPNHLSTFTEVPLPDFKGIQTPRTRLHTKVKVVTQSPLITPAVTQSPLITPVITPVSSVQPMKNLPVDTIDNLRQQLAHVRREYQMLEGQFTFQNSQLTEMEQNKKQLVVIVGQKRGEYETLAAKAGLLDKEVQDQKQNVTDIMKQLEISTNNAGNMKQQYENMKNEKIQLESRLSEINQEMNNISSQIIQAKQHLAKIEEEKKQLSTNTDVVMEKITIDKNEKMEKITNIESFTEKIRLEIDALKTQVNDITQFNQLISSDNKKISQNLSTLQEESIRLKQELSETQVIVDETKQMEKINLDKEKDKITTKTGAVISTVTDKEDLSDNDEKPPWETAEGKAIENVFSKDTPSSFLNQTDSNITEDTSDEVIEFPSFEKELGFKPQSEELRSPVPRDIKEVKEVKEVKENTEKEKITETLDSGFDDLTTATPTAAAAKSSTPTTLIQDNPFEIDSTEKDVNWASFGDG